MIKSVSVNTVLTPAGNVESAEKILGKVIAPPKTRWNPGQLVGSAVGLVESPTLCLLTHNALLVLGFVDEASAVAAVDGVAVGMLDGPGVSVLDAVALPGPSRSRALDVPGLFIHPGGVFADEFLEPATDAVAAELAAVLCVAPRPVMSASVLLSRVDSFFQDQENPKPFIAILNQFNGAVRVICSDSAGDVETVLNAVRSASGSAVIAAFDLAIPETDSEPAPSVPSGPVWG
jgi:hypothetical protein